QSLTIRGERRRVATVKDRAFLGWVQVPQPYPYPVIIFGFGRPGAPGQGLPVRAEEDLERRLTRMAKVPNHAGTVHIPQPYSFVLLGPGKCLAVWAEGGDIYCNHAQRLCIRPIQNSALLARADMPHSDLHAVLGVCSFLCVRNRMEFYVRQMAAVWAETR